MQVKLQIPRISRLVKLVAYNQTYVAIFYINYLVRIYHPDNGVLETTLKDLQELNSKITDMIFVGNYLYVFTYNGEIVFINVETSALHKTVVGRISNYQKAP